MLCRVTAMTSPAAMMELPCNKTTLVLLISGSRVSKGTQIKKTRRMVPAQT